MESDTVIDEMAGARLSRRTALLCAALLAYAVSLGATEMPPPEPALYPAPEAVDSLLLDVARAGDGFVAVGDRGVILRSDDGESWRQVRVPVSVMLNRVAFADAEHGWAVGHDGVILHTTDGGETWHLQFRDVSAAFYDVLPIDADRALVAGGNSRLLRTGNGGSTWRAVDVGALGDMGWNFSAIARLNDGCLMLAGERGLLARACGESGWEQIRTPYIGSFYGVLPFEEHGAAIYGMRGHVFVAADVDALETVDSAMWDPYMAESVTDPQALAEMGWREIETPVEQSLYGGTLSPDGRVVLAGVGGSIVAGVLSGDSLARVPNGDSSPVSTLLVDDGSLLTVGRAGVRRVPFKVVR